MDVAADRLVEMLAAIFARPALPSPDKLEAAFQVVAAYNATRLKPALVERLGTIVAGGPFAGMRFLDSVSEGAYIPKLLGAYESELHPLIEAIVLSGYDRVINIGCAEGYYAVGLAQRTGTMVHAFDIDETARHLCQALARLNGVQERVSVGGRFQPRDFADYANGKVLVVCDIEGDETALLDPVSAPVLRGMDMLVEIHLTHGAWTSDSLFPRFDASHSIQELRQKPR
ncbi:MAG: hypothetical protein PVG24_11890, partial [Gammaproteobacteria bacterium]